MSCIFCLDIFVDNLKNVKIIVYLFFCKVYKIMIRCSIRVLLIVLVEILSVVG